MPFNIMIHSRRVLLGVLSINALFLGGCFTYHRAPGEALAPVPIADDAWPGFDTAPLEPLVETPKIIERYKVERVDQLPPRLSKMGEKGLRIMRDWHTNDLLIARLDEHGLIRVWKDRRKGSLNPIPEAAEKKLRKFDRNASYLTGPTALWEKESEQISLEFLGYRSGASDLSDIYGFRPTEIEERWQLEHGLEMAVPEFIPEHPAGLIIHITGLMESKYEQALTNRLRAHGYAAGYIESDIFLEGPNAHAQQVRSAEATKRRAELREERADNNPYRVPEGETFHPTKAISEAYRVFYMKIYKQVDEELPSIEDGFQIYPDTDLGELGVLIAKDVDAKVAEHAYAAEALVRASDELYPVLSDKPIVVIGYSAGSLVAPGVVARLKSAFPDRPIRLILVGSGGDLLTVATKSTLGTMILHFKPKQAPEPTDEQIETLKSAYLATTRLDPLVLMPTIRDIPVLHLYASNDKAVPTVAAEMLNEAHGHVDRLKHFGNHGTLFYFACTQAGKIRSWLGDQSIQ